MKTADELWEEVKRADQAYCRARGTADVEGLKSIEHLRIASEEAIAAYTGSNVRLAGLPRRGRI